MSRKVGAKTAQNYIEAAKAMYHDEGVLEIDDNGVASMASLTLEEIKENGGSYVKAWIWVSTEDLTAPLPALRGNAGAAFYGRGGI